jgi:hypothetical protein
MLLSRSRSMPKLHAIVAVEFADRVRCGHPGCGHSVYRRIHVVEDGDELLVLGSTCFAKRYGSADALGRSSHGSGDGRKLTEAERQLLLHNTVALLAEFERERAPALAPARPAAVLDEMRAQPISQRPIHEVRTSPWHWRKPLTSMIRFHLQDGTDWVRVQHKCGAQVLVPWPMFDGWDEALPKRLGVVDRDLGGLVLSDVVAAISYLRERAQWERLSGLWREIA